MGTTSVKEGGKQGREKLNCSAVVVTEAKASLVAGAGMVLQNWDSGTCTRWVGVTLSLHSWASLFAEHRFQVHWLSNFVELGLSCCMACGFFLDLGLNPCLLHGQVGS